MSADVPSSHQPKHPTRLNIEAIAKLEEDALHRRSRAERISDSMVRVIGTAGFLIFQLLLVLSWVLVNTGSIHGIKAFDPFPFGVLAMLVTSEGVILTIFVLVSQNRLTRQSERRSHLDLQISLLAEQELTTLLEMQYKICQRLNIDVDSEKHKLDAFTDATDVNKLANELDDKLPDH
jgi:uncharacterized membrane protein